MLSLHPFPPSVPNSITRRSKGLVLATLHVVLGVSANRPLALTVLDASTPMSREQRIYRAVAVAVARRRTTACCILKAQTLGSRSVRLGKSPIWVSRERLGRDRPHFLEARAASNSQLMRYPPLPIRFP
ncbi:hypothetical protein DFH08DRAFT_238576 [Mycena albidolilacea]|uniref:Uncharacterized protein n=1 Tax=Mycena albidolilacea TaxID=1033008 RepID=A0AAD7EMW5_9AGAR|nr:hypothetical protein DFH08DRAFT_238576 [Mycena albidolilacea]